MGLREIAQENIEHPPGSGQRRWAQVVRCRCGVFDHYIRPKEKHPLATFQHFQRLGWEIGSNERGDVCPACATKEKPALRVVENIEPQKPREMSRDDRRIIFGKIDEHYIGEKDGYAAPWTDVTVAHDLGVPVAWVAKVRDEMFGPAGSNAEIGAFLRAHDALRAELAALSTEFDAFKKRQDDLIGRLAAVESAGAKIRKAVGK